MSSRNALSAIALLFTSLLFDSAAHASLIDKVAAVVNNDVILLSDVERFEKTLELRRELDPLFGLSDDVAKPHPDRTSILDFLIQERLIYQTFKIADSEVEQEVLNVQRNNNLSREQLGEFLRSKGFNYPEYFELMRAGLSKRTLLDREIRTRVNITDEDVRNYFYKNAQSSGQVPFEYAIQVIVLQTSSYKSPSATTAAAQEALQALRQGESFGEVAKRYSDGGAVSDSGESEYLSADQLAEPIRSAVRKLQIGGVSDILQTPSARMIVRLVDARSSETQRLQEAKERVRETMARDEYRKQLRLWAERSRNNAYIHINP